MSSWLNLEGKRALITGGAQGLGFAMAESLAAVGVRILIADIDEDHGKKAVEALPPPAEGRHAFTRCDVTQKDDAESAVACAIDQWGGLDILLNNAGIVVARMLVDPRKRRTDRRNPGSRHRNQHERVVSLRASGGPAHD